MIYYQIYEALNLGEARWSWYLLSDDGKEVIAKSKKGFTKGVVVAKIKHLKNEVISADICNQSTPCNGGRSKYKFEYFKSDTDNQWYWALINEQEILAEGSIPSSVTAAGQDIHSTIEGMIKDIRREMSTANITWENETDDPAYSDKKNDHTKTRGIPGS